MQKEGKPDEVTWHARTAPRLIEFAAASVFLWGTIMHAMKAPVKAVKVIERDGTERLIPYEPVEPTYEPYGPPSPIEPLPPGYVDRPILIEEGKLEPPTKYTYSQGLLNQGMEWEGYTWKSGDPNEERRRELEAELAAKLAAEEAAKLDADELARRLAAIEKVPTVTYSQGLLGQPGEMEGVTWRSGTRPQDRPDQG